MTATPGAKVLVLQELTRLKVRLSKVAATRRAVHDWIYVAAARCAGITQAASATNQKQARG